MSHPIYVTAPKDLPTMPTGYPLFLILKRDQYVCTAYRDEEGYDEPAWKIEAFTNEAEFLDAARKLCERGVPSDVIFFQGNQVIPRTSITF